MILKNTKIFNFKFNKIYRNLHSMYIHNYVVLGKSSQNPIKSAETQPEVTGMLYQLAV